MKPPRQLAVWGTAALMSLAALGLVIRREIHEVRDRAAVQVATRPATGSAVFRNKGCTNCHGASGCGTEFGPSLRNHGARTSLPQLVTAMWNHAPHMWKEMESKHIPYPTLSPREMAQLATYLYMSSYADNGGDIKRGERLFRERKCNQCHQREPTSDKDAPGLVAISDAEDPLSWTQALWNHASKMKTRLESSGMSWPRFEASDVRDIFAYVREARNSGEDPPVDVSGDPDRGWLLFQEKRCIGCHAIPSEIGGLGPGFGPDHQLPPTFSEFGAALLNHFPNMQAAMTEQKMRFPRFENRDVADVTVFLYSLHYHEPSGSPQVGKSVFNWRGCSRCHGDNAQGSKSGPALRGRGHVYTAVRMASALWAHGGRMYASTQRHDQPWLTLQDSDVGHLLTFLNTSPE